MDSFNFFNELNSSNLVLEHHLGGIMYEINKDSKYLKQWQKQFLINSMLIEELEAINTKAPSICEKLVLLKGAALLDDIYQSRGQRFMSDIDILCLEGIGDIEKLLEDQGFENITTKTWKGNSFKSEWSKIKDGIDLNIELHERLFYHVSDDQFNIIDSKIGSFKKLALEDNLVHIVGHCGFQHNFQKLYWIYDIYLLMNKYEESLDHKRLSSLINHYRFNNTFSMLDVILKKCFNYKSPWKSRIIDRVLITKKFILDPNQSGFINYLIKHFVKDSIIEALKYDFLWLSNQIKKVLKLN